MQKNNALQRWELALMLGLAFAILAGVWLDAQQSALSDKVIRLHVIANSDSDEDQALKLQVRDRILAEAGDLFRQGYSVDEAAAAITGKLPELAAAGEEVVRAGGYRYGVTASLEDDVWFPTKQYTDFALPRGSYTALRVVIGEGGGKNWWCVVFPPLCLGSVTETVEEAAATGTLSEDDVALMTGEDEGYVIKFKAIELWEEFKGWVEQR
ncbi:MAG: stage II sporulation protein R [Clostridia bacterium]|nr:stage II sporulation protein R [Clostridia bacterium]